MIRSIVISVASLLSALPVFADEYLRMPGVRLAPGATSAVEDLISECVASGGLKSDRPAPGGPAAEGLFQNGLLALGDREKLRQAVAARGDRLTPALRDALAAIWEVAGPAERPAFTALMVAFGQASGDRKALGFAAIAEARGVARGDHQAERGHYLRAVGFFEEAREPGWAAVCEINLGMSAERDGRLGEAFRRYRHALDLFREAKGERSPYCARALTQIGTIHVIRGDAPAALDHFGRALAIYRPLGDVHREEVATILNNTGSIHAGLGRFDEAIRDQGEPLRLLEAIHEADHPEIGACQNNLGYAHSRRGEFDRAGDLYRRALAIAEKAGRPADVAVTLNNLGDLDA